MCRAHDVPCTAHLEILDARDLLLAGLDGLEHITSIGTSLVPLLRAERYRQAVLADNDAGGMGRYALFADADLAGPRPDAVRDVGERVRSSIHPGGVRSARVGTAGRLAA